MGCCRVDFCFKGTIKRPKRFANEVMCFKKNSHYLPRFSELLFERVVPALDAQTWKFPKPGEPCEKHIKGASLPQTQLHCFSWRWRESVTQKNFQGFCDLLWIEGRSLDWIVGGPGICRRQPTWKQMCAGSFVAEERKSGRKNSTWLGWLGFILHLSRRSSPSSTRGRPAISCACAPRRGFYSSWSRDSGGQLQTWEDSGSSLGSLASSRGHPQTP